MFDFDELIHETSKLHEIISRLNTNFVSGSCESDTPYVGIQTKGPLS